MPSSRSLSPLEITLIVIDAVLIVVLIALIATMPEGPDDGSTQTPTATDTGTVDGTASESPSSTQAVTVPEGAIDLAEFATPSGNIWCTITDDAATCEIGTIEYEPPAVDGCDDNDLLGHVLTVTADGASFPCPDGPIADGDPGDWTVLDYDQTTRVGDYFCTSTEAGVTCTNIMTAAGFTVRRAEATRF